MDFPLLGKLFPDKSCAGQALWCLGQVILLSHDISGETQRGFFGWALQMELPALQTRCPTSWNLHTTDAHTRLKSLKWNSLKMASLPSTSFHPTALRFGSSCSLSSVLSLWAFPAWHHRKEREEEKISVAEVGWSECSKQQGIPLVKELRVHGGSWRLAGWVRMSV